MNKFTQILPFVQYLFDDDENARKAAWIVEGILKGRSPRLSDIAREMRGEEAANCATSAAAKKLPTIARPLSQNRESIHKRPRGNLYPRGFQ
jgi:hypothetical protein